MEVHIPAFIPSVVITAPASASRVECVITIASCRLVAAEAMGCATVTITIPYNDNPVAAQTLSLPGTGAAGMCCYHRCLIELLAE